MLRDKIIELMEIRDMKSAELARITNVSPGLLSEVMSGKREKVSDATIEKLAKGLGINKLYFLETDTIGPAEILKHLTEEERDFVLDPVAAPFIKLTREAAKNGITPKQLEYLIKAILENS